VRQFLAGVLVFFLAACGAGEPRQQKFSSEAAFRAYLKQLQQERAKEHGAEAAAGAVGAVAGAADAAAAPADASAADVAAAPKVASAEAPANPGITNNQTMGVDEGGIVKQIGDYLVVLQDGRLFSVRLGKKPGDPLELADRLNVYREKKTAASWYDEMLVSGDRILVTAYSYRDGASEISVFRMDKEGALSREGRYLISSSDYYSAENYATRLVDGKLVIYTSFPAESFDTEGPINWPQIRKADVANRITDQAPLFGATDIYAPLTSLDWPIIHAVSVCGLGAELDCKTTAVIGSGLKEHFVSTTDVFLWTTDIAEFWNEAESERVACAREQATLFRIPINGTDVGRIKVTGVPADQFSMHSKDGQFLALLSQQANDCAPAIERDRMVLLNMPLTDFGDTDKSADVSRYSEVPSAAEGLMINANSGETPVLENRFIGDWLIYSARPGSHSGPPVEQNVRQKGKLVAVPVAAPEKATTLPLDHSAIRTERVGKNALITGYHDSKGLRLTYVDLTSEKAKIGSTLLQKTGLRVKDAVMRSMRFWEMMAPGSWPCQPAYKYGGLIAGSGTARVRI
jgi:hypothetical protein